MKNTVNEINNKPEDQTIENTGKEGPGGKNKKINRALIKHFDIHEIGIQSAGERQWDIK